MRARGVLAGVAECPPLLRLPVVMRPWGVLGAVADCPRSCLLVTMRARGVRAGVAECPPSLSLPVGLPDVVCPLFSEKEKQTVWHTLRAEKMYPQNERDFN